MNDASDRTLSRNINRLDGTGTFLSGEEDKQPDDGFNARMKISEMAKIHDRTNGAILTRFRI